jgi:biotin synthase
MIRQFFTYMRKQMMASNAMAIHHNWTSAQVHALYELPFLDLLLKAQTIHRQYFSPNEIQLSTLLSIKTGACPEDCAYCPQSVHFKTDVEREPLYELERVLTVAKAAKAKGATRFCMGAAWRKPPRKAIPKLVEIIKAVKALGLETCITVGSLDEEMAMEFQKGGLDYYNHNLDTSPNYYKKIITTRPYQERLDTLAAVRKAGMKVCCGGIVSMGETREDRVQFLLQLANLPEHPESVPINRLVRVPGTPLADCPQIDMFEFIATIAIARIMMPASVVRLSAGRDGMDAGTHALCFMAGANSIFYGEDTLLTTPNPDADSDMQLLQRLGIKPTKNNCDANASH